MAFLDEAGLETLWGLIKAEDAKEKVVTGTITTTSSTGGSGITGSATLPGTPKMVFIQFINNFGNTNKLTPIMAPVSGKYVTYGGHEAYENVISYEITVTIDGTNLRVNWYSGMKCSCRYTAFL